LQNGLAGGVWFGFGDLGWTDSKIGHYSRERRFVAVAAASNEKQIPHPAKNAGFGMTVALHGVCTVTHAGNGLADLKIGAYRR
jgi:hypothetical protein